MSRSIPFPPSNRGLLHSLNGMRPVVEVLFQASRDGQLKKVKRTIEDLSSEDVKNVISCRSQGATALVIASKNGHLDVVEYLIKEMGADVEQVGDVQFDGETIEGAPPLWCAAAAGHLSVVKCLLMHGAHVNSTTKTKSTPLRAACYDGHLEIVKYLLDNGADVEIPNRHGHTCLMIACYKGHFLIAKYLIAKGADVNRKSIKGNTALHDCAENGNVQIMQLLLNLDALMAPDSYGVTPLVAAALTGNITIVELCIARVHCSMKEKVEALELMGATYVDKKRDMMSALNVWRRALTYRIRFNHWTWEHEVDPGCYFVPEVRDQSGLDDLFSDPDNMRMQALLLRERILGPAHPDTSYYIRYRGAVYADTGDYDQCIRLWMYALEMQQKALDPLNPMIQSSLLSFAELFSFMMSRSGNQSHVKFHDLFAVFVRSVAQLDISLHLPIQHYPTSSTTSPTSSITSFSSSSSSSSSTSSSSSSSSTSSSSSSPSRMDLCASNPVYQSVESPRFPPPENNPSAADARGVGSSSHPLTPSASTSSTASSSSCPSASSSSGSPSSINPSCPCPSSSSPLPEASSSSSPPLASPCAGPIHPGSLNEVDKNNYRRTLITVLHFVGLLVQLQESITSEQMELLKRHLYLFMKSGHRGSRGRSPLHLSCLNDTTCPSLRFPLCKFPMPEMISLLLEVGADIHETDEEGNGPLHLAASAGKEQNPLVIRMLLASGAHIDAANKKGVRPISLIRFTDCSVKPMQHMTLQCLAARVLVQNRISYQKIVSPDLEQFVSSH